MEQGGRKMRDPKRVPRFYKSDSFSFWSKEGEKMETSCPVITAYPSFGSRRSDHGHERAHPQWLLELETDGTIRHSSSHPSETVDGSRSLVGSNFFDLAPLLGDLSDLKRNFFGFVKSERNRETSCLQTQNGSERSEAIIVLTRSFDTSWHERREIVMMEIRA